MRAVRVDKERMVFFLLSLFLHLLFLLLVLFVFIVEQPYKQVGTQEQEVLEFSDPLSLTDLPEGLPFDSDVPIRQPEESINENIQEQQQPEISSDSLFDTAQDIAPKIEESTDSVQQEQENLPDSATPDSVIPEPFIAQPTLTELMEESRRNRKISTHSDPPRAVSTKTSQKSFRRVNLVQLAQNLSSYIQKEKQAEAEKQQASDIAYINNEGIPTGGSYSSGAKNSKYAHVDDRLARMAYYSYMSKVNRGLKTAFSINRENVYFKEAAQEHIKLIITILKDGSVESVKIIESFGKKDFDEYIIRTVKNYQFAPIPDRLKINKIVKSLDAQVIAHKGANQFELSIRY